MLRNFKKDELTKKDAKGVKGGLRPDGGGSKCPAGQTYVYDSSQNKFICMEVKPEA